MVSLQNFSCTKYFSDLPSYFTLIRGIVGGSTCTCAIPKFQLFLWETLFIVAFWLCLSSLGYFFAKCHTPYVLLVLHVRLGLIILWINVIVFVRTQREALDTMEYFVCLAFCYDWTCDWVSLLVILNLKLLCLDSISFPYWLELIRSSLTTWSN